MMTPPLIALLQAISSGREGVGPVPLNAEAIRWAIRTGFGPLLYRTTQGINDAVPSPLQLELKSADLTARVVAGEQSDAMGEILQACEAVAPPVTLLKGISISEQYYPEPHLRPMRDLDFLVEERALPRIESCLFKLGYGRKGKSPVERYRQHHHTAPLFHSQRHVWVEVHRGLFPPRSPAGSDKVFRIEHVKTQSLPSTFHGRAVMRLSNELQIVYVAAHWASSFKVIGSMVAMLDMIYLLQARRDAIDWGHMLNWLHGSAASTHLYLMLTYLEKYGLIDIDRGVLHALSLCQMPYGSINLAILHTLIDRYYVAGNSFRWPLSLRNIKILWDTLVLPGSPLRNLMLVPCYLVLPWRVRKQFRALTGVLHHSRRTGH